MGVMTFLVPRRDRLAADAAERVYLAGIDEVPWQSRARWSDQLLVVERDESDSGNLFVPCRVAGHGELMLSTASLMERAQPYHLQVELARGTLHRVRNQLASWEQTGVQPPPHVRETLAAAREHLSWATTRQADADESARRAELALEAALTGAAALSAAYVSQALAARHQQGRLSTLLGANLGGAKPPEPVARKLSAAFNAVQVPLAWRDIEAQEGRRDWTLCDAQVDWARSAGFKICGGPLLAVDKWSLPDWMYLFGGDAENFRACVAEHVQAVVERYRGRVHLWVCAAGLNVENEFDHDEEERLRLAVMSIDTIRRFDPRAPIVLSIDQPWAAFMSRQECDLSPLHFADTLARAELGLAGIGLEINVGYWPDGSEPRDPLEFGRQIDRWSTLGLPLLVSLVVPSSAAADANARRKVQVVPYAAGETTPKSQLAWAETYLPLLLAKQPVQGIIWNQLLDSRPHALPHGGLFDERQRPKPLVGLLERLRREHLA